MAIAGCLKLCLQAVLKGRSFSCAVQAFYFCHPSPILVGGGSVFESLKQLVLAVPS